MAAGVQGVTRYLACAPGGEAGDRGAARLAALAGDIPLLDQRGAHLSKRLEGVFADAFAAGHSAAAAMNSDSPQLPASFIEEAFTVLHRASADIVLGPCDDGGYYLIGLKEPRPGLLDGVRMSTPDALADTVARAETAGLRVHLLPPSFDVDGWGDVLRLRRELVGGHSAPYTRGWLEDWNHRPLFRFRCEG
jgi:glycosyltransferase A (GT-A) superfamily protein (DUF2064 family)